MDKMLSFLGFIDHGQVFVRDKQANENDQAITGIGGGIRLNYSHPLPRDEHLNISFNLTYGIPAMGSPDPSDGSNGIVYVSALISY